MTHEQRPSATCRRDLASASALFALAERLTLADLARRPEIGWRVGLAPLFTARLTTSLTALLKGRLDLSLLRLGQVLDVRAKVGLGVDVDLEVLHAVDLNVHTGTAVLGRGEGERVRLGKFLAVNLEVLLASGRVDNLARGAGRLAGGRAGLRVLVVVDLGLALARERAQRGRAEQAAR